jgi:hypothetical protein
MAAASNEPGERPEPVVGLVRLAYMQLVRLVRSGRRPLTAVRRAQLTAFAAGLLLLLIAALTLPPADTGTASHSRATISQLHRLAVATVDSASATSKDVHQAAADQAILATLVLLAAALAALIGARRRGQQPASLLIPARSGRGPPADR